MYAKRKSKAEVVDVYGMYLLQKVLCVHQQCKVHVRCRKLTPQD